MKKFRIDLWKAEEYDYPLAFSFRPNLVAMLHEDALERPCMLVAPGGAYCFLCPTEGEPIADRFFRKGFNCFVLSSTTDLTITQPLHQQPLMDISRAIRLIRANARQYHIDPIQLAVCGFSAGGHLCASICVHFSDIVDCDPDLQCYSNRPDAAILSYPVICSRQYTHRESMLALLGNTPSEEELDYAANEKHVSAQTPPCFIWHTVTDDSVPVENSLLFARACRQHGVSVALHLFSEGPHGLATADENWLEHSWKPDYVSEQAFIILEQIKKGTIQHVQHNVFLDAYLAHGKKAVIDHFIYGKEPVPEVAVWPEMAYSWLVKQFRLN